MSEWRWYSKMLLALAVVAFAYSVWPTPYRYMTTGGRGVWRIARITGQGAVLTSTGWQVCEETDGRPRTQQDSTGASLSGNPFVDTQRRRTPGAVLAGRRSRSQVAIGDGVMNFWLVLAALYLALALLAGVSSFRHAKRTRHALPWWTDGDGTGTIGKAPENQEDVRYEFPKDLSRYLNHATAIDMIGFLLAAAAAVLTRIG